MLQWRSNSGVDTYNDHQSAWISAGNIAAGSQATVVIPSQIIPTSWSPGITLSCQILLNNVNGAWDGPVDKGPVVAASGGGGGGSPAGHISGNIDSNYSNQGTNVALPRTINYDGNNTLELQCTVVNDSGVAESEIVNFVVTDPSGFDTIISWQSSGSVASNSTGNVAIATFPGSILTANGSYSVLVSYLVNNVLVAQKSSSFTVTGVNATSGDGTLVIGTISPDRANLIIGGQPFTVGTYQLAAGTYYYTCAADFYYSSDGYITITAGETQPFDIYLSPLPTTGGGGNPPVTYNVRFYSGYDLVDTEYGWTQDQIDQLVQDTGWSYQTF
jgi:hypothetical protein